MRKGIKKNTRGRTEKGKLLKNSERKGVLEGKKPRRGKVENAELNQNSKSREVREGRNME